MTPAPVPPDGETDAPIPDWEFAGREEDRIRGAQEHAYARGFAAGRAAAHPAGHIYDGSCPDDTQPDARDPKCPACAAAHPDPPDMTNMCEGESPDHKPGITPAASPDERLREAIRAALNELGVPGEGYPAPVANAADILTAALAAADREAPDGRCDRCVKLGLSDATGPCATCRPPRRMTRWFLMPDVQEIIDGLRKKKQHGAFASDEVVQLADAVAAVHAAADAARRETTEAMLEEGRAAAASPDERLREAGNALANLVTRLGGYDGPGYLAAPNQGEHPDYYAAAKLFDKIMRDEKTGAAVVLAEWRAALAAADREAPDPSVSPDQEETRDD